ncbi:hypothetical protein N7452_010107 [Penicillium brevicompactum]|uniref:Uncharacterized protein n=1 Tax=Penicillium brevicompactum TaxID=5074 RepID=A0A9W9UAR7_PENBR|nr:hypothetical protein N7452_010107 [Penicillium brevicompactum]
MSSMEDGFSLIAPATFDPPEQEIPLATTHEHDTLPSDLLDLNDPLKNLLDLDAESATQGLFQDGEQIIGDFSAMEASFLNTDDTDLFEIFEEFRNNTQQESHWLRGL